ncbi:MAG: glutathione S-transferase [Burkholderiaceae bacterium]
MPLLSPLLYTYRRCPYAMRARMALLMAGVSFDAYEIVLRDKPLAMLSASPKGTVPVLVLPDGRVLEQSWDIVAWALSHEGADAQAQEAWRQSQTPQNQQLLRINDGQFKHHLDRYKYPERFATQETANGAHQAQHAHRSQAVQALLEPLDQCLAKQEFLGGAQPCATDVGVFPFVRQFAAVDPDWFGTLPLVHVKTWLAHWKQSTLFEACMQKLPSNVQVRYPG